MNGTVIITCTCKSEFQDAIYGRQRRVANWMKDEKKGLARCTQCKKEVQPVTKTVVKEEK